MNRRRTDTDRFRLPVSPRFRISIDPQWLYIASLAGAAISILVFAVRL